MLADCEREVVVLEEDESDEDGEKVVDEDEREAVGMSCKLAVGRVRRTTAARPNIFISVNNSNLMCRPKCREIWYK